MTAKPTGHAKSPREPGALEGSVSHSRGQIEMELENECVDLMNEDGPILGAPVVV